jgi:peptidoglycan/xylan/chitin deacetylase (PgdA/CDA1 family)
MDRAMTAPGGEFGWPGGARSAAALTFDFDAEEVWIAQDPANAGRPGVLSQGAYGAKVGVGLVLQVLERHGVRATFFVPGRVAEHYPERVREIVDAGHELGHHGYTHTSPTALSAADEEAELARGLDILSAFGPPVIGYRSPSWDFSSATLGLLAAHGFRYSSNLMDDLRPYRHEPSGIVELPVHWTIDDAPHFSFSGATWTKKISTVAEVRSIWTDELDGIHRLGGSAILTMHPQVIGRPGRIGLLEDTISLLRGQGETYLATCAEIAACCP